MSIFPRKLVFEGGGSKGVAHIGALLELEERELLNHLDGVAGSSIGAFVAMMVATGYTPTDILDIILRTNFEDFKEEKYSGFFPVIRHLFKGYGHYKSNELWDTIIILLANKIGNGLITFQELFERTNIELVVTATNLNEGKTEYISHVTYPDLKVATGVLMSMSFPFAYDCIELERVGERVTNLFVDGGMLNNFPLYAFDKDEDGVITPESGIWGFKLMSEDEDIPRVELENVKDYVLRVINLLTAEVDRLRQSLDDRNYTHTIRINTGDLSTFAELDEEQKEWLIMQGREGVQRYLDGPNSFSSTS